MAQLNQVFGQYRLQALIGKGGMAEVHRGVYLSGPKVGLPVAIKRLLPALAQDATYMQLFAAEANLSSMLQHTNIVCVYEAGAVDGQAYIAMEFIDGRDLGQILRRCRERKILLPVDFAVYLGVVLLDALAYAHAAKGITGEPLGIVHCDVSPSNLFISRIGEIKLGDFGIARMQSSPGIETNTRIWGKPYYLSPEVLQGLVDSTADCWAAAATLYELLTNQRPFTGNCAEEVLGAIARANPVPVNKLRTEISPRLNEVVMSGLAMDRAQRLPDAASFADALRPHYNELIGTPLAIAAVVRGLFGQSSS